MSHNTLRYRIARFETLADANLRDQKTAVEVWWALEHDMLGRSVAAAADRTPGD